MLHAMQVPMPLKKKGGGLIYCSEMHKCLHEFSIKTVSDTSLHETSDLI